MYAVIKTGGKQYRVAKNDVIKVERLDGEVGADDRVRRGADAGRRRARWSARRWSPAPRSPATVLEQAKGAKVIVFKKRRRKNYRRRNGHRQLLTVVRIADIAVA